MISQFDIGSYSSYLIADNVLVRTKNNDNDQYIWESTVGGSITTTKDIGPSIIHSTYIVTYLKENSRIATTPIYAYLINCLVRLISASSSVSVSVGQRPSNQLS